MVLLHRRGVKGYVTLNTLVFPRELEDLETTVRQLAEAGVDAVIVQDLGLARLIRAVTPDLEIHASTQMSITSAEGYRMARELGCSRVILARELSSRRSPGSARPPRSPSRSSSTGALRGLFGAVPDQRGPGGAIGEPRRVCPGLPDALPDRLRRRAAGPGKHPVPPEPPGPCRIRPDPAAGRAGRGEPEDRRPPQDAGIRGQYHPALPRGDRRGLEGRAARPSGDEDIREMELSFSRGFSHGFLDGINHKVLVRGDHAKKCGISWARSRRSRGLASG